MVNIPKNQEILKLAGLYEGISVYDFKEPKNGENISISGDNHKRVLIVIDEKEAGNESLDSLLNNILSALSLKPDEVGKIAVNNSERLNFAALQRQTDFHTLLIFGISPKELFLNVDYKKYRAFTILNTRILVSDSLDKLNSDQAKKSLLWNELKRMFEIS